MAVRLGAEGAIHYGGKDEAAEQTVARIEEAGGRAFAVRARFGEDGAVDRLLEGLSAGLAGRGLDIVVNNAGIGSGHPIAQVTPQELELLPAINVSTPFFVIQRAPAVRTDLTAGFTSVPEVVAGLEAITALGRRLSHGRRPPMSKPPTDVRG
ncbi:SDR family NAD(P)-dependent oxidoreductase [Nonomuraea sp. NPDC050691]|uniref:SDR family NAD(P)-dependent oxidoreductase n=1 Tax=Nonomuraea sp. NPDC050691 TaxID=3155661 RepID=UPI0033BFC35E